MLIDCGYSLKKSNKLTYTRVISGIGSNFKILKL